MHLQRSCARHFLSLSESVQSEFAQFKKIKQCRILNVANKQQSKFMRNGWGEGVEGLVKYCEFKSMQKTMATKETREKERAVLKKMKAADEFFG